jgi:hypothetical protein
MWCQRMQAGSNRSRERERETITNQKRKEARTIVYRKHVQMGSCLIVRGDEQTDTIGSAHVTLCASLVHVGQISHQTAALHRGAVDVFVVEGLCTHVFYQTPPICRQSGHADTHVVIDLHQLLLVCRQLVGRPL